MICKDTTGKIQTVGNSIKTNYTISSIKKCKGNKRWRGNLQVKSDLKDRLPVTNTWALFGLVFK